MGTAMLGMLQRARREGLQDDKPSLVGIAKWDPDLSREQTRTLEEKDRPMWRLIQSDQYHTAVRAAKLGIAEAFAVSRHYKGNDRIRNLGFQYLQGL
jgi:hypothetical protein